jgi:hypothetical protein
MFYFRAVYFLMVMGHALRVGDKKAIITLTAILQYFANVVGQRVNMVRFGNLATSDYLLSL